MGATVHFVENRRQKFETPKKWIPIKSLHLICKNFEALVTIFKCQNRMTQVTDIMWRICHHTIRKGTQSLDTINNKMDANLRSHLDEFCNVADTVPVKNSWTSNIRQYQNSVFFLKVLIIWISRSIF